MDTFEIELFIILQRLDQLMNAARRDHMPAALSD